MNTTTRTRAPKGGITVQGVFYRGGQFLPTKEPQRGKWNRKNSTVTKSRKVEVEPYKWVECPEGKLPLMPMMTGIAKYDRETGNMEYTHNQQYLNYSNQTEESARALVELWNSGERWRTV